MIECPDREWTCECGEIKKDHRRNMNHIMICKKCGKEMKRWDIGPVHPTHEYDTQRFIIKR